MKIMLLALLGLTYGCADLRLTAANINQTNTYQQAVKAWDKPKECVYHAQYKYCIWQQNIMVFKDDKFLEAIKRTPSDTNYKIKVHSVMNEMGKGKKVFIQPVKDTKEWKDISMYVRALVHSNGMIVTETKEASEQVLLVDYGFSKRKSKIKINSTSWNDKADTSATHSNTRYVSLKAFETSKYDPNIKDAPAAWHVNVVSTGEKSDLVTVIPVLVATASDYVNVQADTTVEGLINENSTKLECFRHFSKKN